MLIGAGNYGQLRFVIHGAVLQTEEGDVYTFNATHPHGLPTTDALTCPSCTTSGLKVLLPGDVGDFEGGAHLLVLDFDVSESFGHASGESGDWVMHPVIRAAELGFTGSVNGTVDVERDTGGDPLVTIPECPAGTPRDLTAFVPRALAQTLIDAMGDPVTTTTTVAEDGSFAFGFLHPDSYDFGYVAARPESTGSGSTPEPLPSLPVPVEQEGSVAGKKRVFHQVGRRGDECGGAEHPSHPTS